MRWPRDGRKCPDTGPALLARIEKLQDPWEWFRIRCLWSFDWYARSARARIKRTALRQ